MHRRQRRAGHGAAPAGGGQHALLERRPGGALQVQPQGDVGLQGGRKGQNLCWRNAGLDQHLQAIEGGEAVRQIR